jgi:hypothetical protein
MLPEGVRNAIPPDDLAADLGRRVALDHFLPARRAAQLIIDLEEWLTQLEATNCFHTLLKVTRRLIWENNLTGPSRWQPADTDQATPEERRARAAVRRRVGRMVREGLQTEANRRQFAEFVGTHVLAWAAVEASNGNDLSLAQAAAGVPPEDFVQRWEERVNAEATFTVNLAIELYAHHSARSFVDTVWADDDISKTLDTIFTRVAERAKQRLLTETQPKPSRLLPKHRQQTFAEAKAATQAMAAGPSERGWFPIDGEIALAHKVERDSPLSVKFIPGPLSQWMGRPENVETLRDTLARMGIPAVLLFHVCIGELLSGPEVTAGLDQLLAAIGWKPRSTAQRQEMRGRVWEWLVTFEAWQVIGRRPGLYRDRKDRTPRDLTTVDAMIRITGRAYADETQLALDGSAPPDEVTFVAGPWLNQLRGDPQALAYFGDIERIGAIPGGKPSGAWAQSIGLALQQRWREQAKNATVATVGEQKRRTARFKYPLSRRELLALFPPSPTVDEILTGPHPKRAQTYWHDAIALLKGQGIIGFYRELEKLPAKRQDWADPWLDQPLDIRPAGEAIEAVATISTRAKARRRRKQPAPKKPAE